MDNAMNYITLTNENGQEIRFEFLDYIIYDDNEYVVLLEDDVDADEVVILQIEEGDSEDTENYYSVDDDKILQAVFEVFKEKNKDIFDFNG